MSPQETTQILQNLISSLTQQRANCVQSGNLEAVARIDADIASAEATLALLNQG